MATNESAVTELTVEDLVAGIGLEREVILKSTNPIFNNKSVRIRSLKAKEFRQITQKASVKPNDLASNFEWCMEACRIGILTPGIAERVGDLDHDIILQIGGQIIAGSIADEKKIENFTTAD